MPLLKSAHPISNDSPGALKAYFLASRPKTWVASLSPVIMGAALASKIDPLIFTLTLLFSLLIQIGTNYANDYFDFINGADSHLRNGPKRATLEGWISPQSMKRATSIVFLAALLVALPLMISCGLWSFFLALLCISFGILYTGGPKPLGYLGLGELLVFIFFGPVATCGAYFLQTHQLNLSAFIASLSAGLFSCALLTANNLRDEKSDLLAKKMTLIARLGRKFGQFEYVFCLLFAQLIPLFFFCFPLLCLTLPLSLMPVRKVFTFRDPLELISVLQSSSFLFFLYTAIFAYSVW